MSRTSTSPITLCLSLLLAVMVSFRCGPAPAAPSDMGEASLSVSMQALSANGVTRMRVTVTGPQITPDIQYDLVKSGGRWTGIISNIPEGDGRLFKAEALDGTGTKLYEGTSSPVTITANGIAAVVILLQQSQAPHLFENTAPYVTALSASATAVVPGTKVYLSVSAVDVDGDPLTYAWNATGGAFSNAITTSTEWTAPLAEGDYTVSVTVNDNRGGSRTVTLLTQVSASYARGAATINLGFNNSPVVTRVTANPNGLSTALDVTSTDDDGDTQSYQWSDGGGVCTGSFSPNATVRNPVWTAPASAPEGTQCLLLVTVSDGRGGSGEGKVTLQLSKGGATNLAPVVLSAFQGADEFAPEVQVTFRVHASDPDSASEQLTFEWSASSGTLSVPSPISSGSEVVWTAPPKLTDANPCAPATITATVKDHLGAQTTKVFSMSCPVPQLTNGSFETGLSATQVQTVYGTDAASIPGWTVHPHSVDVYPRNAWNMPDGNYALDLCGSGKGAISQVLKTIPGGKYKVSFALAGNPNVQGVMTLRVTAASLPPQDYTFNSSGRTPSNMGWGTREFRFTATTSATDLRFESLMEGTSGPAIDHISVWYQ